MDDNENLRSTLIDILEEEGCKAEEAGTGEEALAKAEKGNYNVAIIDLKLPDTTGIKLLQIFRKRYPHRKNIVVTAYGTLRNTMDAMNLGANAFILKPVDPQKLRQTLQQCMEEQQKVEKSIDEIKILLSEQKLIKRLYSKL
ncbi:MAG: response regulator [Candidatus Bathyarchaeota archaeon]|nr:response regulator [Candidatus Bathyarchaeota archaeon]